MTELMERTGRTQVPVSAEVGRAEALRSLKKKRDFHGHLLAFVLVNSFFWLVWGIVYLFGGPAFPWPVFPLFGWGIGLTFHAWDTYGRKTFSEREIERERARLAR